MTLGRTTQTPAGSLRVRHNAASTRNVRWPDGGDPHNTDKMDAMSDTNKHIVDVLIEERATRLRRHPMVWAAVRKVFLPILRHKTAIQMVDAVQGLTAFDVMDNVVDLLDLDVRIDGLDRVPKEGPVVILPNHPTGIVDGITIYQGLRGYRSDVAFFVNRDAIRAVAALGQMMIPVEWEQERRNRSRSKETLLAAVRMFQEARAVVIFPSGRLAYRQGGRLRERPWLSTPLTFARKYNAPIVPLHINGRNSHMFYFLAAINEELRDMTLFNEMLNKRGTRFDMTFADPIDPFSLDEDPAEAIGQLQDYVENDLSAGRDWAARFPQWRRPAPAPAAD
ncbi:hypothetical protein CCR85_10430 [Rhodothalassium salexigens]|nr:hypothetical protein [Rhodothalassium salexigens]MBK5921147.1 hypothetical protein [Rhodothalassium salexigens]